jgi:hypothetical protein
MGSQPPPAEQGDHESPSSGGTEPRARPYACTTQHVSNGFGLTVVNQLAWVDANHRSFTSAVASNQVPDPTQAPGRC